MPSETQLFRSLTEQLASPAHARLTRAAEALAQLCEADGVWARWTSTAQPNDNPTCDTPSGSRHVYHRPARHGDGDALCFEAHCDHGVLHALLTRSPGQQPFEPHLLDALTQIKPHIARSMIDTHTATDAHPHTPRKQPPLSASERRVLQRLLAGRTVRQSAADLNRSQNTVHSHTKSLYRKLGIRKRAELLQLSQQGALEHLIKSA